MVDAVLEQYPKLRPRFGGQVEVLFFGMRHSEAEGKRMAQDKQMPWLVARLKNAHDMEMVTRFLPGEPPLLVVVTREGIPLFSCNFETKEKVAKTLGDFTSFLEWIQPTNPRAAPDRLQYLRAVQPVAYRTGRCGPVLVIDPFNAAALAKLGVISFDATLSVAADGSITSVDLKEGGKLPEGMVDAVTNGLRQAMIVPAVENGHKIEGTCEYHFQAPQ